MACAGPFLKALSTIILVFRQLSTTAREMHILYLLRPSSPRLHSGTFSTKMSTELCCSVDMAMKLNMAAKIFAVGECGEGPLSTLNAAPVIPNTDIPNMRYGDVFLLLPRRRQQKVS